jgi:hypothetical protein
VGDLRLGEVLVVAQGQHQPLPHGKARDRGPDHDRVLAKVGGRGRRRPDRHQVAGLHQRPA